MNLRSLTALSTKDLQVRFQETFGQTTASRNRPWLIKRLASAAKRQAPPATAQDTAVQVAPPPAIASAQEPSQAESPVAVPATDVLIPPIGSEIRRAWRGQDLVVQVLADGFRLNGTVYRSLSAAATALCGGNRNGLVFFGLKPRPARIAPAAAGSGAA